MSYESSKAKSIFSRIKGYNHWMKTVISINQHDKSDIAKYRLKVIKHYYQFGLKSTLSAFPVKRSTLFLWQKKLKVGQGKLVSLIPQSTRPHLVRQMMVNYRIIDETARLRRKHYRLGKQKLKPLIDKFCKQENMQAPS